MEKARRHNTSLSMETFFTAFTTALSLLLRGDRDLLEIVRLSLWINLSAVFLATSVALPLGAAVAVLRFPGKALVSTVLNALMGLPPVVVGLVVYLLLSRSGPLGIFGLLFTPSAMILAQAILVTPIIAALTRQILEDLHREYDEQLRSLGVGWWQTVQTLMWEGRFSLVTAMLAGFGRASAEVGAVLIVGGNINHVTRVMTTTIALETSKGNLALAMALGALLLLLAFLVNAMASILRDTAQRLYG